MKKTFLFIVVTMSLTFSTHAYCSSKQDVDDLTTYAVISGRAMGCGMDIKEQLKKVGAWMDRTFYGQEKSLYVQMFSVGMEQEYLAQKNGQTPDSCDSIRKTMSKMKWP